MKRGLSKLLVRHQSVIFAAAAFVLVFCAGFVDSGISRFGASTDEWAYNISSRKIADWTIELVEHPRAAFSDSILKEAWSYTPQVVVHPPLSREMSAATFSIGRIIGMDGWRSFRLSNVLFYAMMVAAMSYQLWRMHPVGGVFLVLASIVNVRMHGHIRTAQTDIVLAGLWMLASWSWIKACRGKWRPWIPGVILGLALATKASAILLPPAMILCGALFWGRRFLRPALFLILAVPVSMIFSPQSWVHPLDFWVDWFQKLTDRSATALIPVGCLGRIWIYHAPAWVACLHLLVVIPEILIVGSVIESGLQLKALLHGSSHERAVAKQFLAMISLALVPVASQLMPQAPSHDMERLYLPALPVAAWAASFLAVRLSRLSGWARWLGLSGMSAGILIAAGSLIHTWPEPLAYFNGFIGGGRGAERTGMNSFYFKGEFGTDVIDSVVAKLPDSSRIGGGFIGGDMWMWSTFSNRIGRGIEVRLPEADLADSTFRKLDFWLIYNRRDHILGLDRLARARWLPVWRDYGPDSVISLELYANPKHFASVVQ